MGQIKPIRIINTDFDDYLNVSYAFTNTCNYNCNYCYPPSKEGTHRFPDYDILVKNLDHMLDIYKTHFNKKNIRINLLGGEPTLWPKLGEFAQHCHTRHNCRVTMNTNGSRTLRWWKEYAQYFDDIQISVHHEFVDVSHVINVLDEIYSTGNVMTAAQVLMDPLHWNKCMSIMNQLLKHDTPWLVKARVVMDIDDKNIRPEYTKEQLKFFENKVKKYPPIEYIQRMKQLNKIEQEESSAILVFNDGTRKPYNTLEIWKNHWHKFYNWKCNLGVDRIVIQANGDITGSCTARYVFNSNTVYNILDNDFTSKFNKDTIKPTICREIYCSGCSSDIRLNKHVQNI